jgi:hypothetical protein
MKLESVGGWPSSIGCVAMFLYIPSPSRSPGGSAASKESSQGHRDRLRRSGNRSYGPATWLRCGHIECPPLPGHSRPQSGRSVIRVESCHQNSGVHSPIGRLLPFALLLIAPFSIGCRRILSSEISNSPEYRLGLEAFHTSSKARALLGEHPDAAKGDPHENVHTIGGDGSAEMSLPVSGSLRKGTLYIKATEKSGQWHIDELALRLEGQPNWNELLPGVPSKAGK